MDEYVPLFSKKINLSFAGTCKIIDAMLGEQLQPANENRPDHKDTPTQSDGVGARPQIT